MARSKDYWIYQDMRGQLPWVIHVIATKEGRRTVADADFFADWLKNASKRITLEGMPLYKTDDGAQNLIDAIRKICETHDKEFTDKDAKQIQDDISIMLKDF